MKMMRILLLSLLLFASWQSNAEVDRDRVLVEQLTGIRFIETIDQLKTIPTEAGISVALSGLRLPGFADHFQQYLGTPISLATLDVLIQDVTSELRKHGYPVVDAFAPEGQDITDGRLQIAVLVGRLGRVRVQGGSHFDTASLADQIRLNPRQPITQSQLQADLNWMNDNPYRSVNAVLERGDTFSETNIVLEVEDRLPWRFNLGTNNAGFETVGEDRWQAGVEWGNAFGLEHRLNYQYAAAFDRTQMEFHSVNYVAPLASRHKVGFSAGYVESSGTLDDETFDLGAKNKMFDIWYAMPVSRLKHLDEVMLSLEYLRSNNDLGFGGLNVFSSFTDVVQLNLGATGAISESLRYQWQVVYSPGDVTTDNTDENFSEARFGAEAEYWYTTLDFGHVLALPGELTLTTELRLQYANQNLLSSEQIVGGGVSSVRGYDEFVTTGDRGAVLRTELRAPSMPLVGESFDRLQALAFFDAGYVSSADRLPGESSTTLSSVGLGIRYALGRHLQLRMDYGWQLEEPPAGEDDGRLHLSLDFQW